MQLAIGIDIGGTRIKIGLVNLEGHTEVKRIVIPTETRSELIFLNNLDTAIAALKQAAVEMKADLKGIGIGVPAFVNANGLVDSTYGFLEFMDDNYPLAKIVEERYGLYCRIDNDARVVGLGEALFGNGKGYNRVLVFTLGTGLGIGFIDNKKLVGRLPFGHMGGHQTIASEGIVCYCGKKGCLESLVAGSGLLHIAKSLHWPELHPDIPLHPENIFAAALSGNSVAESIVKQYLRYLKTGIDNFINLLAPDVIVLGGGLSKSLRPYLPQLSALHYLKPITTYAVKVVVSDLEEASGILGAAALVME